MPLLINRKRIHFSSRPLLFIDLEMTGLDVQTHEIVEIAALRVNQSSLEVENSYYTKVIPLHPENFHPTAKKIINYSPLAWAEAIPLHQALVELSDFAPDCILAGWSVQNEWDFLIAALQKEKLQIFFDYHLLEVWTLAFVRFYQQTNLPKLDLEQVCQLLTIPVQLHKPDSDIRATYEIFKKLIRDGFSTQKPRQ
jgi:DNA polymerase III epsilon subunit-like protein